MTAFSRFFSMCERKILIEEQSRAGQHDFIRCQISRISETGIDVFARELRVGGQELLDGLASSKLF